MGTEKLKAFLNGRRILILGFGREGRSTYRILRAALPEADIAVADRNPVAPPEPGAVCVCGEDYLSAMAQYDVVIKSPGIPFVNVAVPDHVLITCQTDLFLRCCDCRTVGVTGTKGKTTTTTLIGKMLCAGGLNAVLMGNMGLPVLENLDLPAEAVAVIEMSSHQLEFTRFSPQVAVITNFYEEHLDHYADGFAGYVRAKGNIARYQSAEDTLVYNGEQGLAPYLDPAALPGKKRPVFESESLPYLGRSKHLRGRHSAFDVAMAAAAAACFNVGADAVERVVDTFEGIPNRLEYVGTYGGIDYYNDSIATIPAAVLNGVDALAPVGSLIIGGLDRGIDYTQFHAALETLEIDNLICLPETGHKTADALVNCRAKVYKAADMRDAVRFAAQNTPRGKACLLSPAAASYNVYKDFEEKGAHYKTLIRAYYADPEEKP